MDSHKFSTIFFVLTVFISLLVNMSCQSPNSPEDAAPRFSGKVNRYSEGEISDIEFSPDGKFVAVAGELGIELYNAQTYKKVALLKDKNVGAYVIAFSPDGQMLAGGDETHVSNLIKLWSIAEKQEITTFKVDTSTDAITFSPDGQMIAIGSGRTTKLWSVVEKREIATFKDNVSVHALAFSPNGQTLAVGSNDETIRLWSISQRRKLATFGESISEEDFEGAAHPPPIGVNFVTFSPDGQTLASAHSECFIALWSFPEADNFLNFGVCFGPRSMGSLSSISFSPDMRILASGHYDGTIKLWSVPEKHEITPEIRLKAEGWSAEGLEITPLKEHDTEANYLAFSPDGRALISGHESGIVQIWNVSDTSPPPPGFPPILSIGDIIFSENVLDANETATISIHIKNIGRGDAKDLTVHLKSDFQGLSFPSITKVPTIPKKTGQQKVDIHVKGTTNLSTDKAKIEIYIDEPHFKQRIRGKQLTFQTRKLPTPKLVLADIAVEEKESAQPNKKIDLNEVVDLKFHVQNLGIGVAKKVKVEVSNRQDGVNWLKKTDKNGRYITTLMFSEIKPGKYETISDTYTYHINREFKDRDLNFNIRVTEQHEKYGFDETKKFTINKDLKPLGKITPVSIDDEAEFHESPQVEELPSLKSSGNTSWIILIVFCGIIIISIIIGKRLNRGKQTTLGTTTTQSKPSKTDPRQKAAYKAAAGRKERFK